MFVSHVAILGTGGMGVAIARRLGAGRHLVLADISLKSLDHATKALTEDGHHVEAHQVDITDYVAVQAFAKAAAHGGNLSSIIHAAGVATDQASPHRILTVDILGTANVIAAFHEHATEQTSMICIASVAAHFAGQLSPEFERHLALAPLDSLLEHEQFKLCDNPYAIAKRANVLRVQAATHAWAKKGARINSVSPGAVITPMGRAALAGRSGDDHRRTISATPIGRAGMTDEVVKLVVFLAGPESSYIIGSDIVVDGCMISGLKWAP